MLQASGKVMRMERIVPIVVILIALLVAAISIFKPRIGEAVEIWQTENGSIKIRVDNRAENCTLSLASPGARERLTFGADFSSLLEVVNLRLAGDGFNEEVDRHSIVSDNAAVYVRRIAEPDGLET